MIPFIFFLVCPLRARSDWERGVLDVGSASRVAGQGLGRIWMGLHGETGL